MNCAWFGKFMMSMAIETERLDVVMSGDVVIVFERWGCHINFITVGTINSLNLKRGSCILSTEATIAEADEFRWHVILILN